MNSFQRFFFGVCLLSGLLTANSCSKKNYNATPDLVTLSQYIQRDSGLTLFRQALQRTGLDTVLAGGGPYTVFAPVDSALISSGLTSDKIASYPADKLRSILSVHILPGRIGSATLTGFIADSMQSLNSGYKPIVTQNYYGMYLNGVRVSQANINLADGIVHKLSSVVFPPTGDIIATLDSLPNTTMAAYMFHHSLGLTLFATNIAPLFAPLPAGQAGYHILDYYTGGAIPQSCTMLIPSDDAFKRYGFNSTDDLAALDSVSRTNLLTSCILYGSFFTADFMGGRFVGPVPYGTTLAPGRPPIDDFARTGSLGYINANGQSTYLLMWSTNGTYEFGNDGVTINGTGITTPPRIVQPNIVTTTGVIHIIDQVFVPNGDYTPQGPQH